MRTIGYVALVLAIAGCEHKNKAKDPGHEVSGSAVPKPNGDLPAEPVGKPQPSPNPAPAGDDVRAPTAADLDGYTKDIPGTGKLGAVIETSLGTMHCQLYPDKAPATIANFVGLATGKKPWLDPRTGAVQKGKPFFDGLTFHRVIANFSGTGAMIQGGDPTATGGGGPGYEFDDEIAQDLTMSPGVLAMANAGKNPQGGGTNGSQFFVIEGSPSYLNGRHTIFGKCKEIEVIKKIASVPQNSENKPNDPVTIKSVTISKQDW